MVDPASDWPLFAEKAKELLTRDKVSAVFGCWTSVSRKSVLPVFEELNGLLFYPVQYEGEESSWNVFYTGAAPNQQAIPAVEYLMGEKGGGAKRFVLLGTDYVYPRTTNKILQYFLKSKGVAEADIMEKYTPFGHSDYQTIVADIKRFAQGKPTAVISTINGDSNVPFYKELANQGLKAEDVPVVAFSVGEEELRGIDAAPLVGHLAAWNYFMSIDTPENKAFVEKWKAYVKKNNLPGGDKRVTNDPMEATYIGIHMWAQAVKQAGTTDIDAVRQAIGYQTFRSPSGFDIADGRQEPPPAQAGLHRRDQGGRSVPDRVEDRRSDPRAGLEPVHPGQRQEGRRLDLSLGLRQLHRAQVRELARAGTARPRSPVFAVTSRASKEPLHAANSCWFWRCLFVAAGCAPARAPRRFTTGARQAGERRDRGAQGGHRGAGAGGRCQGAARAVRASATVPCASTYRRSTHV